MKLNSNSIIEGCVSTDKFRQVLHNVYLDKDAGRLVATDGKIMALVPVEVSEHDTSGAITPEVLKAARKASGRLRELEIEANGSLKLMSGATFPRPDPVKDGGREYPDYKVVIPNPNTPPVFKVTLNAELLLRLAKALDGTGKFEVTLSFESPDSPITVTGSIPDAMGVLMPVRTS